MSHCQFCHWLNTQCQKCSLLIDVAFKTKIGLACTILSSTEMMPKIQCWIQFSIKKSLKIVQFMFMRLGLNQKYTGNSTFGTWYWKLWKRPSSICSYLVTTLLALCTDLAGLSSSSTEEQTVTAKQAVGTWMDHAVVVESWYCVDIARCVARALFVQPPARTSACTSYANFWQEVTKFKSTDSIHASKLWMLYM